MQFSANLKKPIFYELQNIENISNVYDEKSLNLTVIKCLEKLGSGKQKARKVGGTKKKGLGEISQ